MEITVEVVETKEKKYEEELAEDIMVEGDYEGFSLCWEQACEGCGKPATAMQIEWAFECLKDKGLDEVKRALIKHARDANTGQFQPKAADVIKHIDGTKEDRKAMAEAAWRKVIENVNIYQSAVFDDPAIHYAITIGFGDWITLCNFDSSEFKHQQMYRSFVNAYSAYSGQPHAPRMIGIFEQEKAIGETISETRYIGDMKKALEVEEKGRFGTMALASTIEIRGIKETKGEQGGGGNG